MADFEAMLHVYATELNAMYENEKQPRAPKLRLLSF